MKVLYRNVCLAVLFGCLIGCKPNDVRTLSGLQATDFESVHEGLPTKLYVLTNDGGAEVCITNYGARVVSLMMPDREGVFADVVNGFPTIDDYLNNQQNFGATVGRYIGRILNATFALDGETYHLIPNTGMHTSHGGKPGFAERVWTGEQIDAQTLKLHYLSPDGENGFPGNLNVVMIYTLTDENELDITYEATTDKPTVVNLSHHSFFNISGDLNSTIEDQMLYIDADSYLPYDSLKCVTGEIASVKNTPMDFTEWHRVGDRIDDDFPQLMVTGGYDHCWVLNTEGDVSRLAAEVYDEKSGRTLAVYTSEPGLHVYASGGLKGTLIGKNHIAYPRRNSICLETMHFQDSPNKPQFPSTVLRPGETYRSQCKYKFGAR